MATKAIKEALKKFIPRGRLVVELGDADKDGRADVQASLEVGDFKAKAGPINLDAGEALSLVSRAFGVIQDAVRQRLGFGAVEAAASPPVKPRRK